MKLRIILSFLRLNFFCRIDSWINGLWTVMYEYKKFIIIIILWQENLQQRLISTVRKLLLLLLFCLQSYYYFAKIIHFFFSLKQKILNISFPDRISLKRFYERLQFLHFWQQHAVLRETSTPPHLPTPTP